MTRRPLFSTYSQGENRVTGSVVAVFERLDLTTLQEILAHAAEDPSLELVTFRLQPAVAKATVPDAEIQAAFRYLVEVKTAFDSVRQAQIEGHLKLLSGDPGVDERLIVITPDAGKPRPVADVQAKDDRVAWFNFSDLNLAIEAVLQKEGIRDDERLLLRELQILFVEEGLLGRQDTVIVAARLAHSFYLAHSAYVCQQGRAFREGLTNMGFYRKRQIEAEVPRILYVEDSVPFTVEEAERRRQRGDSTAVEIADLITSSLVTGERKDGDVHKVFLLSPPDTQDTEHLPGVVLHSGDGAGSAFTMGQRYVYLDDLRTAKSTQDLR